MQGRRAEPVLFIDVDGVLNTSDTCLNSDHPDRFYPEGWTGRMQSQALVLSRSRLERFAELVSALDASVCLSTSWRTDANVARPALQAALSELGVADFRLLGQTPDLHGSSDGVWPVGTRVEEISTWLACQALERKHVPLFWIAIDDMELAKHAAPELAEHFVETECDAGLTDERAAEVRARAERLARRGTGGAL